VRTPWLVEDLPQAELRRGDKREDGRVKVTALAGGVGAGKFLRGLVRAVPPEDVTVVVNTGDDIAVHGLHISPDLDSVTYWLAAVADRDRGWGRQGETFRATTELGAFGAEGAWFGLGDLDLATHLYRTGLIARGATLSAATAAVARRFGIASRIVPMSDQRVTTRVEAMDVDGEPLDLHFQEYWVQREARDDVKAIRYDGADEARPAPGVEEAIAEADVLIVCPSNPVASIDPILAIPGMADAVAARQRVTAGISPIVGGAPLRGMADKLLPAVGVEVSAAGVAAYYARRELIGAWVMDQVDGPLAGRVESLGLRVSVADTIMVDDEASEALARIALEAALGGAAR
jgi:LPPG:FO 2-phospho-L-lactate transferase